MSKYPIANQPESRRCENCGAPIMGRFSPCVVCHSLALEGPAAHAGPVSGLYGARPGSQQQARAKLPGRRFWHPSPDTLVYPYDSIDEAELAAHAKRRARSRIVLGASVLAVSSAVYLVCMHADDWRGALSVGPAHDVSARNDKPSVAVAAAPRGGATNEPLRSDGGAPQEHPQQQAADVKQRVASVRPSTVPPVNQPAATTSGQHRLASALTDPARVAAAQVTGVGKRLQVDAGSGATAQQQPTVVAQNVPTVRPAPLAPPAALPPEQHQVASASPDSTRGATARSTDAEEKPRVEVRPGVSTQQRPAVVAQNVPSVGHSAITPPATLPSEHRQIVSASPDSARVAAAQPTRAEEKPHVDARPSVIVQQQQPAVVAQNPASVRHSTVTPPAAAKREHQQPVIAAQNHAPVGPTAVTPPVTSPAALSAQHRIASATPAPTHATAPQPVSAEDKQRADAAKYLREARASMKANNLAAAKSHLAAASAAQPGNREARRLRAAIHTLEQQRDALLSLARSCGDIGHLACTSRDAGIALQIDSSSKAARRLATRAMRESELRIEPQPQPEAVSGPLPAMRYVSTHH